MLSAPLSYFLSFPLHSHLVTQLKFSEFADDEFSTEVWVTGPLDHDSSAREVEIALEALTGIGDVAVHAELLGGGDEGRVFSVVWPIGVGNVPKLDVNGSGLTPGSDKAAAVAYVNEVLVCSNLRCIFLHVASGWAWLVNCRNPTIMLYCRAKCRRRQT